MAISFISIISVAMLENFCCPSFFLCVRKFCADCDDNDELMKQNVSEALKASSLLRYDFSLGVKRFIAVTFKENHC
jgi:hypothetical protein